MAVIPNPDPQVWRMILRDFEPGSARRPLDAIPHPSADPHTDTPRPDPEGVTEAPPNLTTEPGET